LSSKAKDITDALLLLPSRYAELFRQRHRVAAFAWNNVCLALTADLDLLEVASGREGLDSARIAIAVVTKWSQTQNARRAILHAAQIFDILSSSRLGDSNIARQDLLLYNSALVLSMYLFVCHREEEAEEELSDPGSFELLQDIDWALVGEDGMRSAPSALPSPAIQERQSHSPTDAARYFIRHGGLLSFAGELQHGGGVAARKILLNYVRLLDDLGKWRGSRYSQLLRTMSEFVMEGSGI
jgi:hypothetical protein